MSDAGARSGGPPHRPAARTEPAASPLDAQAATDSLLGRLRAAAGVTRVSVWVPPRCARRRDGTIVDVTADVVALERLAARTWRGLEQRPYGDWLLRSGGGFTGRANSVLVVGDPPEDLPAAVATVTAWYSRRGLRPRAQLPMPGSEPADAAFDAAGWARDDDNLVLTAPLAGWAPPRTPVDLAPAPDAAWLTGYRYRGTPLPAIAHDVLVNAEDPVFAAVRCDAEPAPLAAVARGVVVDGWLVVTAVTVNERYRRLGLATAVMAALGEWARQRGGHSCLLQVAGGNGPALALYDRLGFTEHHRYHYRLGAVPGSPVPG